MGRSTRSQSPVSRTSTHVSQPRPSASPSIPASTTVASLATMPLLVHSLASQRRSNPTKPAVLTQTPSQPPTLVVLMEPSTASATVNPTATGARMTSLENLQKKKCALLTLHAQSACSRPTPVSSSSLETASSTTRSTTPSSPIFTISRWPRFLAESKPRLLLTLSPPTGTGLRVTIWLSSGLLLSRLTTSSPSTHTETTSTPDSLLNGVMEPSRSGRHTTTHLSSETEAFETSLPRTSRLSSISVTPRISPISMSSSSSESLWFQRPGTTSTTILRLPQSRTFPTA